MTDQSFESQFELAKQMAQRSGIRGTSYIHFKPASGFLRVKLEVTPPEYRSIITSGFAQVLAQGSAMFGLQVKFHQDDDGKVGAET